jgi:UDP-N-acetylglucosamine 3-dehydrogenase
MNVAIIGCNSMGRLHARMASNCGLRIVACGDARLSTAAALADEHVADASDDCMAVIARPDVDIVGIMTPTPTHAQYVIAAAAAGKHIFCEKPFGRTVQECRQAVAAAKKAKVKLFVAHVVRYFQEYEAIRAQIAAGKIGKPGFVKMYRGGICPAGADGWFRDFARSGGVTLDSMIHDFDWLRYTFGEPERIFCQGVRHTTPEFVDYSMATVRMKSGIIAKVIGTWAHPSGFRVEVEVCGDGGMLQYSSTDPVLSMTKRVSAGGMPGMIVPESPVPISPYQLEWQDFLTWIEGRSGARVTPNDALEAVRMATAALESSETGKPVNL